jgi:hypothetical protein
MLPARLLLLPYSTKSGLLLLLRGIPWLNCCLG